MFKRLRYKLTSFYVVKFLKFRIFPSLNLFKYLRMVDLPTGLSFSLALVFRRGTTKITLPGFKVPVLVRLGTSDIGAFNKIFLRKEYDIPLQLNPRLIIDGGANVGYASVFFANKYPRARIIAVEPEESNYRLLKENTSAYPNITPVKGALWYKETTLNIKSLPVDSKWDFKVEGADSKGGGQVKSFVLDKLSNHEQIDILKLDIEGAEKEVFSQNYEIWLDKVKVIIVELHDHFKSGCSESLHSATDGYGFRESKKGEHVILVRE